MKQGVLSFLIVLHAGLLSAEPSTSGSGMSLSKMVETGRAQFLATNENELRQMRLAFAEREQRRGIEGNLTDFRSSLVLAFGRSIDTTIRKHTIPLLSNEEPICAGLLTSEGLIVPLHTSSQSYSSLSGSREIISREANLAILRTKTSSLDIHTLREGSVLRPGSFICSWLPDGRIVTGTVTSTTVESSDMVSPELREGRRKYWQQSGFSPSNLSTPVRTGIECDLAIKETELGSPVFDLKGNIVGLAVARLDVQRTVVIPLSELKHALEQRARR